MSDFSKNLKNVLTQGAKHIRRTAAKLVSSTKYKANELSTLNERRELVSELGAKMFEYSQKGFLLPDDANQLVQQIASLDNDLSTLRAAHVAEKAARAAEKASAKAAAAIAQSTAPVNIDIPETKVTDAENPFIDEEGVAPETVIPSMDDIPTIETDAQTSTEVPTLKL